MFDSLKAKGFQVECTSHAEAILTLDFPGAASELEQVLADATLPIHEIIAGGGGEAEVTQRLRRALTAIGWKKYTFTVQKVINGVARQSQSHEIDHVKIFPDGGTIAMEIEWNNKDPFFDRDLENFKRLHADGAISVGIIITRGRSLHENMRQLVRRFLDQHSINSLNDIAQWGYDPTSRQRKHIASRTGASDDAQSFREVFASKFVADKFGEATTHWRKLEDRINRGVGNPCPLVFLGLPAGIVTFDDAG